MPQRVNSLSDIGTARVQSDSYDVDNIFLTDQGWVYRHFKKDDKSRFWDEIIVAGQVSADDGTGNLVTTDDPVALTKYSTTGGGSEAWAPTAFEAGDSKNDIEYGGGEGGSGPSGYDPLVSRYTTYEQYPPLDTDTDTGDGTGDGSGSASAPSDVTLVFTGADGTSSYTSAGGANASVTIEAGGTLTITNNTGGHPVDVRVSDEGATVSTGTLSGAPAGPGESLTWDTTGVTPGTYYYQCTAHATMVGQIIVT